MTELLCLWVNEVGVGKVGLDLIYIDVFHYHLLPMLNEFRINTDHIMPFWTNVINMFRQRNTLWVSLMRLKSFKINCCKGIINCNHIACQSLSLWRHFDFLSPSTDVEVSKHCKEKKHTSQNFNFARNFVFSFWPSCRNQQTSPTFLIINN